MGAVEINWMSRKENLANILTKNLSDPATIRFYTSDMILHVDSDAAYLVMPGAKSHAAGNYHLSNTPPSTKAPKPFLDGAIHIECKALRHVISSAMEAECVPLFYNAKSTIEIRRSLEALVLPQFLTLAPN